MATKSKKGKVVNKDDLRRLMKEKTQGSIIAPKKVDSPLAKYDSLGNLYCIVCNAKVKNNLVWNAHILGRSHKENVARLKEAQHKKATVPAPPPQQPKPPPVIVQAPKSILKNSTKRKAEDSIDKPSDKTKKGSLPSDFFDKNVKKPSLGIASYDSDSDEEDIPAPPASATSATKNAKLAVPSELPADFFDKGVVPSTSAEEILDKSLPASMSEKLPEGFFDDPKMDAKVREVEYKDKMDEEWELFQKEMKAQAQVSEAIEEEDAEVIQTERDIEEVDEQLFHLKKVTELAKQKDTIQVRTDTKEEVKDDSDDDMDEEDLDNILMDWRGKQVLH